MGFRKLIQGMEKEEGEVEGIKQNMGKREMGSTAEGKDKEERREGSEGKEHENMV